MRIPLILIPAVIAMLSAQDRATPPHSTLVRATGEAAVVAAADQSTLNLEVNTTARTAERAREKNAERTTALIAQLRDLLGKDAGISTMNYALTKDFREGYAARNVIQVHLADPAMTGKAIDVAVKSGAEIFRGARAGLQDDQTARLAALKQATVRARANAEAIVASLGMRVIRIVSAETVPGQVPAIPQLGVRAKMSVSTSFEPGPAEVHVQVSVTLEAAP